MKAFELSSQGLVLVDRPAPTVGPRDVKVRVGAVSLNYRDLAIARNAGKRTAPVVPTSDGAGEVIAIGDAVSRWKVGDRVAANFFPTWQAGGFAEHHHANALGGSIDGMLAEEVVLPETAWVALPAGYSFEQGATLPCAAVTAWHALHEAARVKAGDVVVVQGTGGVSMFALQLARAAGATVIATSRSADKRARLTALGAAHTIDYVADPAWGDTVRTLTGGRGADIVVEVGGAGTFDQSARALAFAGTMSLVGVLAGTQAPISTYPLIHKRLQVHGVYVGSVAMFEDLVRALTAGNIEPIIDRTFDFADTAAAYDHLGSGAHFGKVVIRA